MTLLAGAAAMTALLASGCGAGQIAETAEKVPAVPGANKDVSAFGGSLSVRNAMVVYHDGGYEKDADAPVELHIFNDTAQAVTVTITSPDAERVTLAPGAKGTPSPSVSPSASPTPTATATPSATATPTGTPTATATPTAEPTPSAEPTPAPAAPARVEIAAGSFAALTPAGGQFIELIGLNEELTAGKTVELIFDFGGGTKLTLDVPVGVPLTPVPRGSAEVGEGEH